MNLKFLDPNSLRIIGSTIRDRIKKRIRSGKVSPKTNKEGGTTLVESGRLVRSINYEIRGDKIAIGTNVKYARIHHEGGTIVPKQAQFLAIPISKQAKVRNPRDFENTFVKDGVIFQNQDGKAVPLYALKKQVKIPKRPYMFVDKSDIDVIKQRLRIYWSKRG